MGNMDAFVGTGLDFVIRKGCAGVPNPDDEDGTGSDSVGRAVDRGVLFMVTVWFAKGTEPTIVALGHETQHNAYRSNWRKKAK